MNCKEALLLTVLEETLRLSPYFIFKAPCLPIL